MAEWNLTAYTNLVRARLAEEYTPLRVISAATGIPQSSISRLLTSGCMTSEARIITLARYLGLLGEGAPE